MRRKIGASAKDWTRCSRVAYVMAFVLPATFAACIEDPQLPPQQPIGLPTEPTTPTPPTPPPLTTPPTATGADTLPVRIAVETTGEELDPDGYVVEISTPFQWTWARDSVGSNGSTVFQLPVGWHHIYLSGVAPNCTAVEEWPFLLDDYAGTGEQLVTVPVTCWSIPASQGVRITTITTGTLADTASFRLTIHREPGAPPEQHFFQARSVGANESVTMPSPVGSFRMWLSVFTWWENCTITPSHEQKVVVVPNQMSSLTFNLACKA
jgi:hypothetical protein